MNKAALLLLPNLLGDQERHSLYLPNSVDQAVSSLDGLIAESEKAGRKYLSRFEMEVSPLNVPLALYSEHTPDDEIDFLLEPLTKGERWGLISDCGVPCVADPGHKLVHRARQLGIAVRAYVGPSSLLMGLMLSGLPGQRFMFHGYLDRDPVKRKRALKRVEETARRDDATQIFMEAPYRNQYLLEACVSVLHPETVLSVAWELTLPDQGILTQPIRTWKKSPLPNLEKRQAIFLIKTQVV